MPISDHRRSSRVGVWSLDGVMDPQMTPEGIPVERVVISRRPHPSSIAAKPLQHRTDMERKGRIRIRTADGLCVACEHPHTLDISYRCVGCDREVCALCIVTVRETREGYCPACDPDRPDRPGGGA